MSKDSRSQKPGRGTSKPRGGSTRDQAGAGARTRGPAPRKTDSGARRTGSAPRKNSATPRNNSPRKSSAAPHKTGSAQGKPGAQQRASVYRRRRAVLGTIAVLVLAAVIFGVAQAVSFVKDRFGSDDPEAMPTTTAESSGPSEEELANPQTCSSSALELKVDPASTTVAAGSSLEVPITVTNEGKVQCLVDVGNSSMQMTVTSGDDTVWSTDQCPANPEEHQVLLAPGATEKDAITWSGTRSDEGCPKDAPAAEPGTYQVEVSVAADGGSVKAQRTVEVSDGG